MVEMVGTGQRSTRRPGTSILDNLNFDEASMDASIGYRIVMMKSSSRSHAVSM
jgi:hypothetical protein